MPIRETGGATPLRLDRARPARSAVRMRCATCVATLVVITLCGCAYFNTFYRAKRYFAKAQRIEEQSKSDRLSPEAEKNYDLAIERSAKVIVEYGGGWRAGVDDALFLMGACYYGKREYQTAIDKFNELVLHYPASRHVPEALFYTGMCFQRMHNATTANRVFMGLLQEHPGFARRDEILYVAGEGLEAEGDRRGAVQQYQRLLAEFPKSRKREDALQKLGDIYFEAGAFDSAYRAYDDLARVTRDDARYIDAQLDAGAALVRMGQFESALSIYARIMPNRTERSEAAGRIWLAMADAQNRSGEHDDALENLKRVKEDFANQNLGTEALFMTGYTYEVYLHDYAQAREAYTAASADRTRSLFKDQAARRLENVKTMLELEQGATGETAPDSERRADAALRVAEFTLFEGNEPRQALEQYAGIEREFPSSQAALRAAYARAWILEKDLDSSAAATRVLLELIEEHPGSKQALGALDLLDELGHDPQELALLRTRVEEAQAAAAPDTAAVKVATADTSAVEPAGPPGTDGGVGFTTGDTLAPQVGGEPPWSPVPPDTTPVRGGNDSLAVEPLVPDSLTPMPVEKP